MHAYAEAGGRIMDTDLAPRMLDAGEAARYLRCGKTKLHELTARGEVPSVKWGRTRRWLITDLDDLIARNRTVGPTMASTGMHRAVS
jgi:excisionase family DNA binding protein